MVVNQNDNFESEYYTKNLGIIKKRFPHIYGKLKENKEKMPFSVEFHFNAHNQINGMVKMNDGKTVALYADENIVNETEKTIHAHPLGPNDVLMCIGMGLGYVPLIAAEYFDNKTKILVIEPSVTLFDYSLRALDLNKLLKYPELELQIGDNISADEIIAKYKKELYACAIRRITHMPSRAIFGKTFVDIEKEVTEKINTAIINWNTIRKHGKKLFINSLDNLISMFCGASLGKIKNKFENMPAICVASGPSLEDSLPALKKIKDKALILSCDSAIKPLLRSGIKPHMLCVVDHNAIDYEKIRTSMGQLRDTKLVFLNEANPNSVSGYLGADRMGISAKSAMIDSWLGSALSLDCKLKGNISSNTDAAVLTAIALGASPIILIGVDLAFTDGKDHSSGVVFKNAVYEDNMVTVEGVKGTPVYSPHAMITGRVILEKTINESGKRFVDSSMNGALIKGTEIKTLEEIADTELSENKLDANTVIKDIEWSTEANWDKVLEKFDELIQIIVKFSKILINEVKKTDEVLNLKNEDKISWKVLKQETKRLMNTYSHIISDYTGLLDLLNFTRFQEQLDVDRKIANLGVDFKGSKSDISIQALKILKDYYCSLEETLNYFSQLIENKAEYFKKINNYEKQINQWPGKALLKLDIARLHAQEGQLWLAEKWYYEYMACEPNSVLPYVELIGAYMELKLWKEAKGLLEKGRQKFPLELELTKCEKGLESKIDDILTSAKELFEQYMSGEQLGWQLSRRSLMDYMEYDSDNPEAFALKEKLDKLDNDRVDSFNKKAKLIIPQKQVGELENKASGCIFSGQLEQAVGIFHGLKENCPEKAVEYYTRIGDTRFEQADYSSALWNYKKAMVSASQREKELLDVRIQHIEPLIASRKLMESSKWGIASLIIPIIDIDAKKISSIQKLSERIGRACEIILLVDKGKYDEIYNINFQKNKYNCLDINILDFNSSQGAVKEMNRAINKSIGEYLLFVDLDKFTGTNTLVGMIDFARAKNRIGMIQLCPEQIHGCVQENEFNKTNNNLMPYPMKASCPGITLIPRNMLERIGLLDEKISHFNEAIEDIRIRADIEGYENLYMTDPGNAVENKNNRVFSISNKDNDKKWQNGKIPEIISIKMSLAELYEKADVSAQKGDFEKSLILLTDAIKKHSNEASIYLNIAQLLLREERYDEAMDALKGIPKQAVKKAVAGDSKFIMASDLIFAQCHLELNDNKAALPYVERMLVQEPLNVQALCCYGRLEASKGNFNTALEFYEKAMDVSNVCGDLWFHYAKLMEHIKEKKAETLRYYEKAFYLSPINQAIMSAYYLRSIEDGRIGQAIEAFKAAVRLYPNHKRLCYLLIDLLLKDQQDEEAMKFIEFAIVRFGKVDGILNSAMAVREQVNARKDNNNGTENKTHKSASIHINTEIRGIEKYLLHLKENVDEIFLQHNGNAPESARIAEIFGAKVYTSVKNELTGASMRIEQPHVVNWIAEKERMALL